MHMSRSIRNPLVAAAEYLAADLASDKIKENQIFRVAFFRPVIAEFTAAV